MSRALRPGGTPPTTIRLDADSRAELERLADTFGLSMAEVVRRLLLGIAMDAVSSG
jgi:antitoxin component of RelBE/YafQ-DinJ toxin-antitoxin module